MTRIHLIQPDGAIVTLDGEDGKSVMQLGTGAGLRGIVGECGGSAMCATCHVYVEEPWAGQLPEPLPTELEMLECTAAERRPTSRLSCQIQASPELDGMRVFMPETQS
jgi:2Fe-2S ferredoxin